MSEFTNFVDKKCDDIRNDQEWQIRYFMLALECDFRILDALCCTGFHKIPIGVGKYITYTDTEQFTTLEALNDENEKIRAYLVPFSITSKIEFAHVYDGNLWVDEVTNNGTNRVHIDEYTRRVKNLPFYTQFVFVWIPRLDF
jgi:hypothetical protein